MCTLFILTYLVLACLTLAYLRADGQEIIITQLRPATQCIAQQPCAERHSGSAARQDGVVSIKATNAQPLA